MDRPRRLERAAGTAASTLVFTTTFPQFPGDPRGAFIAVHWEALARAGGHVRVLAPETAWVEDSGDGRAEGTLEVTRFRYAPKRWSTVSGRHGIVENLRERPWRLALLVPFLWAARRAIARELRQRPAKVVAHMLLPGGALVAPACIAAGIPFELYGHGTDVDLLLGLPRPLRSYLLRAFRRAEVVRVPSQEKLERLRAVDPSLRLHVEPMVHCVPPPAPLRARGRTVEPPRVLFLGRLILQKGVDDLLRAVARLQGPVRLEVAGDGPERKRLERLARELGVDARFHGYVAGATKEELFAAADVLCVPSRELRGGWSEGAPLVVREAAARGLPVVATRVGGIPELCVDLPGTRLVPQRDPEALACALQATLAAPDAVAVPSGAA